MDEKIEQVSYENINFINNLGNTDEGHNIVSFHILNCQKLRRKIGTISWENY